MPLQGKNRTRRRKDIYTNVALCGVMVALMLVLGYVERLIPVATLISGGIPGVKLGLANSVLVYAVYMMDDGMTWLLMVVKVVLSGIVFGNLEAMSFSLAGGVLSVLGMTLLHRFKGFSVVGVSIVGGVLHNVGQVLMAILQTNTPKLVYYMCILMVVGLITGALTGIIAKAVMGHLGFIKKTLRRPPSGSGDSAQEEKPAD